MPDIFDHLSQQAQAQQPAPTASKQPAGDIFDHLAAQQASGSQPAAPQQSTFDKVADTAAGFDKQTLGNFNPITMAKGLWSVVNGKALTADSQSRAQLLDQAEQDWHSGNYGSAAIHALDGSVPVLGPMVNEAGRAAASGDHERFGRSIANLASFYTVPGAMGWLKEGAGAVSGAAGNYARKVANANPMPADQVEALGQAGVKPGAGPLTGSKLIQHAQKAVGYTLGGADVAADADRANQAGLAGHAQQIAGSVKPFDAMNELSGNLNSKLQGFSDDANANYGKFRELSASPENQTRVGTSDSSSLVNPATNKPFQKFDTVSFPVDYGKTIKPIISPMVDSIKKAVAAGATPGMADVKLMHLMDAPDINSAEAAEKALGDFKDIARGASNVFSRNEAQGLASKAIGALQPAIDDAIGSASPEAQSALRAGRAATRQKYDTMDLMDDLGYDSKKNSWDANSFGKLNGSDIKSKALIDRVSSAAPEVKQSLGQAFLQNAFEKSTEDGGFGKAGTALTNWNKIGDNVKSALFEPQQVNHIDSFLRGAKRIEDNPNGSNTGAANMVSGLIHGSAFTGAIPLIMHHPILGTAAVGASFGATRGLAYLLSHPESASALKTMLQSGVNSAPGRAGLATVKGMASAAYPAEAALKNSQDNQQQ